MSGGIEEPAARNWFHFVSTIAILEMRRWTWWSSLSCFPLQKQWPTAFKKVTLSLFIFSYSLSLLQWPENFCMNPVKISSQRKIYATKTVQNFCTLRVEVYGANILQEQYNMWGAHGAKMSTCCNPPRQKKPNCDRRMHIAVNVIIFSSSFTLVIFLSAICYVEYLQISAYDICWFGVPWILNYSHSKKKFSWSIPDNLFYVISCDHIGTWAIRSEPVSCRCVSALFVLNMI